MIIVIKNKVITKLRLVLVTFLFSVSLAVCGCNYPIWSSETNNTSNSADPESAGGQDSSSNAGQSQSLPQELKANAPYIFNNLEYQDMNLKDSVVLQVEEVKFQGKERVILLLENSRILLCEMSRNRCAALHSDALDVAFMDYSKNGNLLALGVSQFYILVYDLTDGKLKYSSRKLRDSLSTISFDRLSESVIAGSLSGRIYQWHFTEDHKKNGKFSDLTRYSGHATIVKKIIMHNSNRVFFSSDWQGKLSAWLTYESEPFNYQSQDNVFNPAFWSDIADRIKRQLAAPINDFILRSDGKYILIALKNGSLSLWSVRGFQRICNFTVPAPAVQKLIASPDWKQVLAFNKTRSYLLDLSMDELTTDSVDQVPRCEYEINALETFDLTLKKIFLTSKGFYSISADAFNKLDLIPIETDET